MSKGLPFDEAMKWLQENGGYRDCEALAYADQAWKDALHDANW